MVRLYLALVVRLHVGYAWLPDAPGFVELALQFKLPFNLKDGSIALALW